MTYRTDSATSPPQQATAAPASPPLPPATPIHAGTPGDPMPGHFDHLHQTFLVAQPYTPGK